MEIRISRKRIQAKCWINQILDAQEGHYGTFAMRHAKGKGKVTIWQEGDDLDVNSDAYMADNPSAQDVEL
eukprot:14995192-Heterocapsa_arctica.AAC.1